jgi:hypothetical protein
MAIFRKYRLTGDAGSLSSIGAIRDVLNSGRALQPSPAKVMIGKLLREAGARLDLRPGWYDTHVMHE